MRRLIATSVLILSSIAQAQIPVDVTLDPVPGISGLNAPLGIQHAGDGSGRLFIVQQGGTIRIIDDDGTLRATPFIDIGTRTTFSGERGLLDIAFHPQFSSNGLFYLHYSAGGDRPSGTRLGDTVVAEFSMTADPNVANNAPNRIILTASQDFANHNGGQMRFGPDGYLYLGLGDGGNGNDPCNRARTLDPAALVNPSSCGSSAPLNNSLALLGKMLRVDVDNSTPAGSNNLCAANANGSANYAIPAENPFAGQANRCGEVLLYGLRNPWRWSFDRQTQDLWIGDVGQNIWEEIDFLPWPLAGGEDLGWKVCEGSFLRGSTTQACNLAGSVLPVMEYSHSATGGCSVTGGYRYRGPINSLQGFYVFGDFCSGEIWFGNADGGSWNFDSFAVRGFGLRSFGEDQDGRLYAILGSTLLRFNGNETDLVFEDGFESAP